MHGQQNIKIGTEGNHKNEECPTPWQGLQYETFGLGTIPAQFYNDSARLSYLQHEEGNVQTI